MIWWRRSWVRRAYLEARRPDYLSLRRAALPGRDKARLLGAAATFEMNLVERLAAAGGGGPASRALNTLRDSLAARCTVAAHHCAAR